MLNRDRFLAYLKAYEDKDIEAIAGMFADKVWLRDWEIFAEGKTAALRETRRNFESAQHLEIIPLKLFESENTVAAELQILVNGSIDLRVVDVVEFDHEGRIASIRAYKGRPENG